MGHSPIITQHDSTMPDAKKAPKKAAAHPPFNKMIAAAIAGLKERGGSSRQAILKYVVANNKVDAKTAAVNVRLGLKKGLAKGTLKKARASGKGAGKFRLGAVPKVKKPKKNAAKKAKKPAKKAAKKPAKKAVKKPAKKAAKKPAKKAAPKKAKK